MSKQDLKNKYNRVAFDNSQLQMFAEDVIDGEIVKEGMQNPMTAAGDVIVGGASGAPTKLALGAAGQVLKVNAAGTGLEYGAGGGKQLYLHRISIGSSHPETSFQFINYDSTDYDNLNDFFSNYANTVSVNSTPVSYVLENLNRYKVAMNTNGTNIQLDCSYFNVTNYGSILTVSNFTQMITFAPDNTYTMTVDSKVIDLTSNVYSHSVTAVE